MTEGRGRSLVDEGGADKTMLLGVELERHDAVARLASDEEVRAVDGVRGRGARTTI